MKPDNAVKAVTQIDPYPYYAELTAGPPLVFDEQLKVWIAASAATFTEVLNHSHCRVRPASEPVPNAIAGTTAGEIFGQFLIEFVYRITDHGLRE